jgi:hypothetical protein
VDGVRAGSVLPGFLEQSLVGPHNGAAVRVSSQIFYIYFLYINYI